MSDNYNSALMESRGANRLRSLAVLSEARKSTPKRKARQKVKKDF